jgi:small subunit ribosomal protein S17
MEEPDNITADETPDDAVASGETTPNIPGDTPSSEASDSDAASAEGAATSGAAASGAAASGSGGGPQPVLTPKERRQASRAERGAKRARGSAATPEERHADRVAARRQKAVARRTRRLQEREKARTSGETKPTTPPREHASGAQKTRQGIVVSDKADKTITVRIDVSRRHRSYSKIVRTSTTLHAHDESNDANIGDTVVIREARPLSRTKRWRLVEVVQRAK